MTVLKRDDEYIYIYIYIKICMMKIDGVYNIMMYLYWWWAWRCLLYNDDENDDVYFIYNDNEYDDIYSILTMMTMFSYDDDVNDNDMFCLDDVHNRKSLHL